MALVQEVIYPESDGLPMADNTKQARWIVVLYDNLEALYAGRMDVFVAANSYWYPREFEDTLRAAPDVYVVFGRPKGDRGSYQQWKEMDIPLTVVFEILSPSNDADEMMEKRDFYEENGVEEYYVYDPQKNSMKAYIRGKMGAALARERFKDTFTSPRMGIRFDMTGGELRVFHPNGEPFRTFDELDTLRQSEAARAKAAEAARADAEAARADAETRATNAEAANRRLARIVELLTKAASGPLPPDELAELDALRRAT